MGWSMCRLPCIQALRIPASILTGWTSVPWIRWGYKRINKRTGKEVPKESIVKGVKVSEETYVLLSDDEIKGRISQDHADH